MRSFRRLGFVAFVTCGSFLVLNALANAAVAGILPVRTPEIDPTSICSAIALLIGGGLYLTNSKHRS